MTYLTYKLRLALLHQQGFGRGAPQLLQLGLQRLALQGLLAGEQRRGHRQQTPGGKRTAQLRGTVAEGRVFPVVFQQSTAGTDGLQQGGGSVGAEDESGIGRSLLHHLQQDILIPLVQLAAVRDDVYLAPGLVGADVHILTQGADCLHRQLLVLCIQHGDHVRVDALQYLAAVAAAQAGPVRPLETGQRRSGHPGPSG